MKFEKLDDATLIQRIAQAETGALEELYDRYNHVVFSVALAILNDPSVAEEVTLDVFVRVWKGASTYQAERGKVSTWLAAITRPDSTSSAGSSSASISAWVSATVVMPSLLPSAGTGG